MGMIQDFQKADEERRREVAALAKEADAMLKDFAKGSAERASDVATMRSEIDAMVNDLARGSAQRRSEVATMLNDLAKGDTERASEVATMRAETDAMVNDLARGSAQRRSDVATMLGDLAKGDAERASEVADIRSEVATMVRDLRAQAQGRKAEAAAIVEEADAFVKDLARGSAQRRTMVWGTAPARKVAAPPVAELPEEMPPIPEAPAGELRDSVFAYLADHPDGTKLVELEEEFGLARIQMAKVIRGLIDDNKVEKRELFYFAI